MQDSRELTTKEERAKQPKTNAQLTRRHSVFGPPTARTPVRYVRARSTANNYFLLLMLGTFVKAVEASYYSNSTYLKHKNTVYEVAASVDYTRGTYFDGVSGFFANVSINLLNGVCGNVTRSDLRPINSDSLLSEPLCFGMIEFLRDTLGKNYTQFENCVVKFLNNSMSSFQQPCDEQQSNAGGDALIALGIIFGSFIGCFLLVGLIMCIVMNVNCERRHYEEIPAPDVKPPRNARKAQTEAKDPEIGAVNASNDEYELPDSRRELNK